MQVEIAICMLELTNCMIALQEGFATHYLLVASDKNIRGR